MAKTRVIRKRIASVRNIHKITRTMEKVAQSKGMKLAGRFDGATAFFRALARVLPEALGAAPGSLQAVEQLADTPLGTRRGTRRVLLFVVTSSRGLCGGYNARVIQAARARMRELAGEGKEALLAVMGRKGLAYFRFHAIPVAFAVPDADENLRFARVEEIGEELMRRFTALECDEVEVISTRYKTKVVQEVRGSLLLPFLSEAAGLFPAHGVTPAGVLPGPAQGPAGEPLYIVEPDRARVLALILPQLVKVQLFCTMLEAMVSEQAQRSIAMRSASDNAESMTKRLTRAYNRARQAQITNEMIEIISGSEGGRS